MLVLAIIVACLATFRNLFSRENNGHKVAQQAAPASSNLFLRGSGSRKKIRDILASLESMPDNTHSSYSRQAEYADESQSIVGQHQHGGHYLVEMPKAV